MTTYSAGRAARQNGRPVTDNPHQSLSKPIRWSDWRRGWEDQDYREKRK